MKKKEFFLGMGVLLLFLLPLRTYPQYNLPDLNYNSTLPEGLLSGKSVVFVSMPDTAQRDSWKDLADSVHRTFFPLGIDAVAYYKLTDVFAGIDASKLFLAKFTQRQIKNVILLRYGKIEAKETLGYSIIATPFNPSDKILRPGQNAWKIEHENLALLLENFTKIIWQGGLEKSNYLVLESPEFFSNPNIVRGHRFYSYPADIKLDKLAVIKFENADAENEELKAIMQDYPFNYEIISYNNNEKILRNAGFQFILMWLNTDEEGVKSLLNYEAEEESSEEHNISRGNNPPVYKFYIKHIYSGDVYLGDQWDVAESWQEALTKHLLHLKSALKIN